MEYRSLENTAHSSILAAFNEAFADYAQPVAMTADSLAQMQAGRGYDRRASLGAFAGEKLVGFVLNGLRDWQGAFTAYDIATGLSPAYRGQGIASNLLKNTLATIRQAGARQYLLEVLQDNTSAVALYRRQGFAVTRELLCYRLEQPQPIAANTWPLERPALFSAALWQEAEALGEIKPSWQNNRLAVEARAEQYAYLTYHDAQGLAAYGMIDRTSGDIPQLAVRPDLRGRGLGGAILAGLIAASQANQTRLINVEVTGQSLITFLEAKGFREFTRQYEMLKVL